MSWSLHFCPLHKQCRHYGAPWRLHLNTPWWHLGIALLRSGQFVRADGALHWISWERQPR